MRRRALRDLRGARHRGGEGAVRVQEVLVAVGDDREDEAGDALGEQNIFVFVFECV